MVNGSRLGMGVKEGAGIGKSVNVGVGVRDGVKDGVIVDVGVLLGVIVGVRVLVGDAVVVAVRVGVKVVDSGWGVGLEVKGVVTIAEGEVVKTATEVIGLTSGIGVGLFGGVDVIM